MNQHKNESENENWWWFNDEDEKEKKKQQKETLLPRDYPLIAHVFLHVGEMLLAITLADFFLGTLPKFTEALAAYLGAGF